MTSVVQPMDQGIIKNFKHHYRTPLVLNLLQDGGKIDILQANRMSKNAWEQVTSETIANCFRKAGFLSGNSENVGDEEIQQTIIINVWDDVRQDVNINFDDYINMDDDLEVCGHLSDSDIIQLTVRCTQSSDEEEEQECIEPPILTSIQARMHINELRRFIENKGEVCMMPTKNDVASTAVSIFDTSCVLMSSL
ncbi:tigger transposable element-derived protein 6-like [Melanaphis sacchari]|uniref:tigger transposable element-derived protein 6-like n=1 Tax=Melanaphis sacchari TaxID=742174 RepID=UPI000DC14389|nr:tigger transposable element-derived protein 6-like [Melanaphis sacchari]